MERDEQEVRAQKPRDAADQRHQDGLGQSCRISRSRLAPRATRSASSRPAIHGARGERARQVHADRQQQQQRERVHGLEESADSLTVVSKETRTDQSQRIRPVRLRVFVRQLARDRIQVVGRPLGRPRRLSRPITVTARGPGLEGVVSASRLASRHPVVRPLEALGTVEGGADATPITVNGRSLRLTVSDHVRIG